MEISDGGIIIVAQPRTGSTNLMRSIGSFYNKKTVFEPDLINNNPKCDCTKDVVKFFPYWPAHFDNTMEYDYDVILKEIKKYNTIILLSRKNKEEQIESFYSVKHLLNAEYDIKWGNEIIDKTSKEFKFYKEYIKKFDTILQKISEDLNIDINYYEDVYKNKKLNNDIKLDLSYFSNEKKLRQVSKLI